MVLDVGYGADGGEEEGRWVRERGGVNFSRVIHGYTFGLE